MLHTMKGDEEATQTTWRGGKNTVQSVFIKYCYSCFSLNLLFKVVSHYLLARPLHYTSSHISHKNDEVFSSRIFTQTLQTLDSFSNIRTKNRKRKYINTEILNLFSISLYITYQTYIIKTISEYFFPNTFVDTNVFYSVFTHFCPLCPSSSRQHPRSSFLTREF